MRSGIPLSPTVEAPPSLKHFSLKYASPENAKLGAEAPQALTGSVPKVVSKC